MLHTRVSEQLSEDIRRLAEDLRVPASNLVRNVLEEVFSVVESVSDDVGGLFDEVLEEADGARERIRRRMRERRARDRGGLERDVEQEFRTDEAREAGARRASDHGAGEPEAAASHGPEFEDVIGWQPLVLHRAADCARCQRSLRRGEHAYVGLGAADPAAATLCRSCGRPDRVRS